MKVFALGDLHLSANSDKPMDVFGAAWDNHFQRISDNWQRDVTERDLVLIPGDISWAMRLEDALADIQSIGRLNGTKVIMRGNHDYWWNSLARLRAALPGGMYALQNDAVELGGVSVAGSRGWVCPGSMGFDPASDTKLYERELIRLDMSLKKAAGRVKLGMLHYPPFNERRAPSGFTQAFERAGVSHVVYGHLHDKACKNAFEGVRNGITYTLCSADHLDFAPRLIIEV